MEIVSNERSNERFSFLTVARNVAEGVIGWSEVQEMRVCAQSNTFFSLLLVGLFVTVSVFLFAQLIPVHIRAIRIIYIHLCVIRI